VNVNFTPREVVSELDRYIIGQDKAKRAVAVALRNRWRRQQVPGDLRDEITPKNIIMIGPTGVGKTEIARRIAKLANAPFIKVEASKFTEVGYVGKDVESMIRELTDIAVKMVREEEEKKVGVRAREAAEDRVLELFDWQRSVALTSRAGMTADPSPDAVKEKLRELLRQGALDDELVELPSAPQNPVMPTVEIFGAGGMEEMGRNIKDMISQMMPQTRGPRKIKAREALEQIEQDEAANLIDMEAVKKLAIERTEQHGIVFLDEIDKIAGKDRHGPDVSREGVQRDILPVVEGSSVITKHGMVRTDFILFIAAGAFHMSKPSDLIPELQGRFPIRVELDPLTRDDFFRIITEPKNSLQRQYTALLATEKVHLRFTDDGMHALCDIAVQLNEQTENIGARRLHTVMERVLEDIAFHAPERPGQEFVIDKTYVEERLSEIVKNRDLSRYIL